MKCCIANVFNLRFINFNQSSPGTAQLHMLIQCEFEYPSNRNPRFLLAQLVVAASVMCVCEEMGKMMLMLLILGLFIPASQAYTCYYCTSLINDNCDDPTSSTRTCTGDVCLKAHYEVNGLFTAIIYLSSFRRLVLTDNQLDDSVKYRVHQKSNPLILYT